MESVSVGDLVLSVAGRDKGEYFVVVCCDADGKTVKVVSGKTRKAVSPKKKNVKHVKIVKKAILTKLAKNIIGAPISDKRVRRLIKSVIE